MREAGASGFGWAKSLSTSPAFVVALSDRACALVVGSMAKQMECDFSCSMLNWSIANRAGSIEVISVEAGAGGCGAPHPNSSRATKVPS